VVEGIDQIHTRVAAKTSERGEHLGALLGRRLDEEALQPGPLTDKHQPFEQGPAKDSIGATGWRAY
jgi:hypothetical protein